MEERKLIIIGSGPAAYTAAIYAARANLEPLLFTGFMSGISGGQLMTTTLVENFPGFTDGILGPTLMDNMKAQAIRFGTAILNEDVVFLDLKNYPFKVKGSKSEFLAKTLIIATGAHAKKLDVVGVKEFWQKGVTACAVCDGASPIFRNADLFVIGGGDSAVEEAIFLTKYAKKVFIVHRRDELKASKIMAKRVLTHPKIEILWNKELVKVEGQKVVSAIYLQDVNTKQIEKRQGAGVFFAIGHEPNTKFLQGGLDLTENGYIITKKGTTQTSKEAVFAAGDVQDPLYRQAIVAAGFGCMAAMDAERYLSEKGLLL